MLYIIECLKWFELDLILFNVVLFSKMFVVMVSYEYGLKLCKLKYWYVF